MNFVIENLRVGDKVRIKENGVEGYLYNIDCIEKRTLELESKEYEIEYVFSVISGTKVYTFLNENDFDLIEQTRTINDIKKEDLENAIQKFLKLSESIEKYASMGKYATDRKENVSNFEKMEQNTIEKRENEPLYEINERFAKILKKELEEKPNLEINLGKPNIDDKEFKEMLKNKPIVSNTNEPLEMIWNSNEEETKPSLLTEDERVILRNVDECCKWISRDRIGDLFVYNNRSEKEALLWVCSGINGLSKSLEAFNHLFQFIKWEDDKPYNIEELLKGECGNE